MTAHFVEEQPNNFVLNDRILCTREMTAETKDGKYIRSQIKEHLKSFNLYSHRRNFVFVSDRGSNMISALKNFESIHCFAHMLNNTVQHMLEIVNDDLTPVKALVKYFKVTGLNSRLDETLKSYVKTRWNSVYHMIQSVLKNWPKIQEILTQKNEMARINHINIDFLQVFPSRSILIKKKILPFDCNCISGIMRFFEDI